MLNDLEEVENKRRLKFLMKTIDRQKINQFKDWKYNEAVIGKYSSDTKDICDKIKRHLKYLTDKYPSYTKVEEQQVSKTQQDDFIQQKTEIIKKELERKSLKRRRLREKTWEDESDYDFAIEVSEDY